MLLFRSVMPNVSRPALWVYLFLATASHGVLDAMTDGGLGVAFFSPFNNRRYFFSWTPIRVSPIGIGNFFSSRGLAVVQSELLWVWIPAVALVGLAWILRKQTQT
jgi:inner membrane protein